MKRRVFVTGSFAIVLALACAAEAVGNARWVGVWQGELDGQPGVTLTLADDAGELGGTIVLNMVSRQGGQPHVIWSEPHVLVHPRVDGDVLAFHVKRTRDGRDLESIATLEPDQTLRLRCTNCGTDSPSTELVKVHYAE